MREILFRAKRKDNGEWVKGFYVKTSASLLENIILPVEVDADENQDTQRIEFDIYYEVIPETVGQYTGMKDNNGKPIFEGDIVRDREGQLLGNVIYATAQDGFDGMSGFMVDDVTNGLQNCNGFWHLTEIIGNIYDNPELLKGTTQ